MNNCKTSILVILMALSSCTGKDTKSIPERVNTIVKTDTMRYFLAVYHAGSDEQSFTGNLWFTSESFPNNRFIKEYAAKEVNASPNNVVVTNIIEFKNEQDFLDFTNESK
jgi:hypothetical protein